MTELNQIYKCGVCGNIVEMVHTGKGQLVCCGKPMELKKANDQDASLEKHVPVVETTDGKIKVAVGSVSHPMQEEHFIEWIEVVGDSRTARKYLKPGDEPAAEFSVASGSVEVRAYCNLHGLWKNK